MKLNNIILGTVTLSTLGLIGGLTKQASASTGVSVYRLYNPNTGEHFYTENAYEKNSLSNSGWKYEGIGWQSATSGTPVYRVYNPNAKGGDHYYTMSRYEAQSLISQGWRWDNGGKPSFYSAGNTNLYVAYNPNAQSGSHNYTTNSYEQNSLLKGGWKYGSVAWKVMGSAPAPENNSSQQLQKPFVKDQNNAISQISGFKYLSDSDKASFVNSIKATTDVKKMATIVSNAQKINDDAKSLNDTKADAINTANGFKHISDVDRASTTSAINAATSKDAVASELSKLTDKEKAGALKELNDAKDKAGVLKELNDAKDKAISTINGMKYLQADQKSSFVSSVKASSDLNAVASLISKVQSQDAIEATKGTITFEIVDFNGNHVSTVTKRVVEGSYSFTLSDLGVSNSNIKFLSGDLNGSIKAQENKSLTIKTVDTSQVQTVNVTAIDEETGNVIKKITLYYKDGDTVFISPSTMGLNPDDWMSPGDPSTSFKANAGVVYDHTINFTVTKPQLSDDQIAVANAAFMQLINQYRKDNGVKELIEDSRLDAGSAIRAKETSTVFSHMRPDGTGFNTAIYQAGITDLGDNVIGFGENIASTGASNNNGAAAALRLFTMWKNSPGHNANMLDPDFTRMGIGIYATPIGIFASTLFLATYDK